MRQPKSYVHTDEHGVMRVGDGRVMLDSVVASFAETIAREETMPMSHTITLDLPDQVFQVVQRTAQATNQPIESLLVQVLQATLPPLEGVSEEIMEKLTALEIYDDETLWRVMGETVPVEVQQELSALLTRRQSTTLTEAERGRLAVLQGQADLVMLRKARAAVLLRFRGKRLPTLTELSQHVNSPA